MAISHSPEKPISVRSEAHCLKRSMKIIPDLGHEGLARLAFGGYAKSLHQALVEHMLFIIRKSFESMAPQVWAG